MPRIRFNSDNLSMRPLSARESPRSRLLELAAASPRTPVSTQLGSIVPPSGGSRVRERRTPAATAKDNIRGRSARQSDGRGNESPAASAAHFSPRALSHHVRQTAEKSDVATNTHAQSKNAQKERSGVETGPAPVSTT